MAAIPSSRRDAIFLLIQISSLSAGRLDHWIHDRIIFPTLSLPNWSGSRGDRFQRILLQQVNRLPTCVCSTRETQPVPIKDPTAKSRTRTLLRADAKIDEGQQQPKDAVRPQTEKGRRN